VRGYGREVLIALDVAANVILLKGKQGQTISGRLADAMYAGRKIGCIGCKILDWFDKGHCDKAIDGDMRRAMRVYEDLADIRRDR
jgi:hypothetical protein